ncbi:orotidine 5'-phosphate decarboxylase / HUMPS family protein [Chlamydiifrater volucris]|uniref:orotidine 5'-phosphate decarboxylase / HUMPS family protein n=1 Tax=Chlamydiifrater volucris TaxID=2681470 RepID=UPI001BCD6282|nr:orotidine 5'-phosphate decarboxylase / HUMPS family protein [Chlamydiifrater volucris]
MQRQSYEERANLTKHPLSRKLFSLMHSKQTNLGVIANSSKSHEILKLAETIGPNICILKTHVDILEDFTPDFSRNLRSIADKHQFLIFEDRKYSELGEVVERQYGGGLYKVVDWADLVSVHLSSGEKIIDSLSLVGKDKGRGIVLLADSSMEDISCDSSLVAIRWAEKRPDFIMGFECSRRLCLNEGFLHFTSIRKSLIEDTFCSIKLSPEHVIGACGGDVILIDDSFLGSGDPEIISREYRNRGYIAYNQY